MNEGLIPRRYAKALLKLASERGSDGRLYQLMTSLERAFAGEPGLERAIVNPFVTVADKTKLLTTASGATADDSLFADFISLLVKNRRIDLMRHVAIAYGQLYRKANNIYRVNVVSAAPLPESEQNRLRQLVQSHLGDASMEYTTSVDPDLIGGFVVNIDSERLDASVKNELKQLRQKLLSK